jgi:hypothetical protein
VLAFSMIGSIMFVRVQAGRQVPRLACMLDLG